MYVEYINRCQQSAKAIVVTTEFASPIVSSSKPPFATRENQVTIVSNLPHFSISLFLHLPLFCRYHLLVFHTYHIMRSTYFSNVPLFHIIQSTYFFTFYPIFFKRSRINRFYEISKLLIDQQLYFIFRVFRQYNMASNPDMVDFLYFPW